MRISRRGFLLGLASAAAGAWGLPRACRLLQPRTRRIEGGIVGASHRLGHRLRSGGFPVPSLHRRAAVAIAGGGVAGLAAAWKLRRSGCEDVLVLDLEPEAGGTSRGGLNPVSAHPWGAHYLPLPGRRARAVRELLQEAGILTGWTPSGEPVYDEKSLCFAPQERIFLYGRWQEGLFPSLGASTEDLLQLNAFRAAMAAFREGQGFEIPMAWSRRDAALLDLDRMSMAAWMASHGWNSVRLRWYVDYCCRDDFGCSVEETSAWAAIHYFASREEAEVLTWPEGNQRLLKTLASGMEDRIVTGALVHRIEETAEGVEVDYLESSTGRCVRVSCGRAVAALPQFVLRRVAPAFAGRESPFEYAPWMVANLTVDHPPLAGPRDAPLSWDNVLYSGKGLGYVNARHQSLAVAPGPTVLTYYRPFSGEDPVQARIRMLTIPWEGWRDEVLADLAPAHPDLGNMLSRLDVMLWGHGMVRPRPGLIWGDARERAGLPHGRIHPAHADLSGMALFEEAQYRGVLAAESVLKAMGRPFESSL